MIGQINLSQSFGDTLRYVLDRQGVCLVYDSITFDDGEGEQLDHKAIALSMRDTAELRPRAKTAVSPAVSGLP